MQGSESTEVQADAAHDLAALYGQFEDQRDPISLDHRQPESLQIAAMLMQKLL